MREEDIIRTLRSHLAASPRQRNAPFTSDAEIAEVGGRLFAFTVDEFSAEDALSADEPRLLGWNVVTATLSDLLAAGAEPRFLLNSLVVGDGMGEAWLAAFASGMQEALDAFGAFMLGGDAGTDRAWRCTGVAVGTFPHAQRPLSRIVPTEEGVVLATGSFGDGNLAAAGNAGPRFECRLAESKLIAACDAACMDTSDGLAATLQMITRLNERLGITLDLAAVPYADGVEAAAAAVGVPREAFLFGSAGEYELVAFAPEAAAASLLTTEALDAWHAEGRLRGSRGERQ